MKSEDKKALLQWVKENKEENQIRESRMVKMSNQIKAVVLNTNENPKVVNLNNELETFKEIVGGYIEVVRFSEAPILMIVNEEGKLRNLEPNLEAPNDIIVGNVVFVGVDEEDFDSVPEEYIDGLFEFIYSSMIGVRED